MRMIKSDPRAREKPCLRCGYSLKKSLDSKFCPECGLSVWLSLNPNDTLDWSRPEWLSRLGAASLTLAFSQLIAIAALVMGKVEGAGAIVPLLAATYIAAYSTGLVLASLPERRYPDRLKSHRIFVLCCGVAGLLAAAALLAFVALHVNNPPEDWDDWIDESFLASGIKLVALVGSIATWVYMHRLARRIPNAVLARICGWLSAAPALSLLKAFPFFSLLLLQVGWLFTLLMWAYLPFSCAVLVWLWRIFTRSAVSAEASWASETGAAVAPGPAPAV